MATQPQIKVLNRKLEVLIEDKEALSSALDGYISHILAVGSEWIQSQGSTGQTFQEICIHLDQTTLFIAEKLHEISAQSNVGETHSSEIASSLVESSQKSTSIHSSTSTTLPPRSPGTSSLPTRFSSTLADDVLLKLEERVEALESEMTTVSKKIDKITEMKSGVEETSKSVNECKDTSAKEQRKLSTLKTRFDDLLETFNTSAKEYTTNKNKNDALFKKFEQRQNDADKDLNQLTSDVTKVERKVKRYDDRFGEMDKKVVSIEERFEEVEKEKDAAITRIRGLGEGLETCQAQLEKVDGLDDKVKEIEEEREGDRKRMKRAEERLGKLEEERVDLEIQRLGILEDRLLGVEEERRNDSKEFGDIKTEMTAVMSRIQDVEKKQEEQHQQVGFTACTEFGNILSITCGAVIKGFNKILSNMGGHYDATTGVFTAPVSGFYLAGFCYRQYGEGDIRVSFCHEKVSTSTRSLEITGAWTCSNNASSSSVILLDMVKGDKLNLTSYGNAKIGWPSAFTCALLG